MSKWYHVNQTQYVTGNQYILNLMLPQTLVNHVDKENDVTYKLLLNKIFKRMKKSMRNKTNTLKA